MEKNKRKLKFRQEAMEAAGSMENIGFDEAVLLYKLDCYECKLHDGSNPKSVNCRDNPYCINRLGLEKFQKLLKDEFARNEKVQKDGERRDLHEKPCGLINTGNFCYVNSFLQIWFNEPGFRQIIYDWRPSPVYIKPDPPAMDVEDVMNSLQHLFFTLQTTPYMDTAENSHFINSLRLDNQQQDAQEFTLVFLEALDRNLSKHPNGEPIRQAIKKRCTGVTQQRIWCTCGKKNNIRESPFTAIQLLVGNHKSLLDSFNSNFGEEILEDAKCDQCMKRGNVRQKQTTIEFPDVLILQLSRYVYEATGRRKLKSPLQYPKEFSSSLLNEAQPKEEQFDYELFAVLIHEGDNTHCGHYYDLVKHPITEKWFRYDDAKVENIKAPGCDKISPKAPTRPTVDMKACYGLVYRRKAPVEEFRLPPEEITLQWETKTEIAFCGQTDEELQKSKLRIQEVTDRSELLTDLFNNLKTHTDKQKKLKDIAFLPTSLLCDILNKEFIRAESIAGSFAEEEQCVPVDNNVTPVKKPRKCRTNTKRFIQEQVSQMLAPHRQPLCCHGKVFIDDVLFGDSKAVARLAAETLLTRYGIVPTVFQKSDEFWKKDKAKILTGSDICIECCQLLKREAQFQDKLEEDLRLVNKISKEKTRCSLSSTPKPEGHLYVSKKCLTNFKKLAIRAMENQLNMQENNAFLVFSANAVDGLPDVPPTVTNGDSAPQTKKSRGRPRKRLMDMDIMESSSPVKARKNGLNNEAEEDEDAAAIDEDDKLLDNMVESIANESDDDCVVISKDEYYGQDHKGTNGSTDSNDKRDNDSASVDRPSSAGSVMESTEFNSLLRCHHENINVTEYRCAVSPEEWTQLTAYFPSKFQVLCSEEICRECLDLEKEILLNKTANKERNKKLSAQFSEVVREIEKRVPKEEELGIIYTKGICSLFFTELRTTFRRAREAGEIPMICQSHVMCHHGKTFKLLQGSSTDERCIVPVTEQEWQDFSKAWTDMFPGAPPDPISIVNGRLSNHCDECYRLDQEDMSWKRYQYTFANIYVRLQSDLTENTEKVNGKSSRRVGNKNLYKVKMSSNMKVQELKVKLYKETGQSPNDQLLYGPDLRLLDNDQTLAQAKILPNDDINPLVLIAQSFLSSPTRYDEQRAPERGFVDTALAH